MSNGWTDLEKKGGGFSYPREAVPTIHADMTNLCLNEAAMDAIGRPEYVRVRINGGMIGIFPSEKTAPNARAAVNYAGGGQFWRVSVTPLVKAHPLVFEGKRPKWYPLLRDGGLVFYLKDGYKTQQQRT